ncbi:MAG: glycosyltransferase family 1 protein [Bdellovibrionota bacterium]
MNHQKTIMIDARVVEKQITHGIACYVYEIVHNLIHKYHDSTCFYFILINKNSCLENLTLPKNIQFVFMRTKWASFLGQFELCKIIFKYKPQLFHAPSFIVPLLSQVKLIATIHDMNHVALSQNYSFIQKIYYFFLALRLAKNSLVLTVSKFSKNEIIKYLKVPKEKVHVIYNGISKIFKPKNEYTNAELQVTQKKYHLPEKYWFTVGNSKPHKNLESLLEAYCQGDFLVPLVVLSNNYEKLFVIAEKYNKTSQVVFLPHLEKHSELAQIYALSALFIFSSLYEGFGFPPLEAAACGTSVLASNVTSLPEIMADSATYFDPTSINDMRNAMQEAHNLGSQFNARGLLQAKKFDWELATQALVELYNAS